MRDPGEAKDGQAPRAAGSTHGAVEPQRTERSGALGARLPGERAARAGGATLPLRTSRADFVMPLMRLGAGARLAVPASILAVTSGMFFNGYDSASGKAMFCAVMCAALMLLVAAFPPPLVAWRRARGPLLCFVGALVWLVLLQLLAPATRFTPDLLAPELLGRVGCLAALLCGLVVALRRGIDRGVIGWLVATASLSLALGMIAALLAPDAIWMGRGVLRGSRFAGVIGNNNVTATVAGVTLLLALHRFTRTLARVRKGRADRSAVLAAYGLAVLLAAACQLWTGARVTVAATLVLSAGLLWHALGSRVKLRLPRREWLLLLALVLVVGAVFGGVLAARLDEVDRAGAVRHLMWSRYLDIALAAPLTGYGPGAFPTLNALVQPNPFDAQATWSAQSAHNVGIQLLLVGGLPYALALLAGAGLIARTVVRSWRRRMPGSDQVATGAALALILAAAAVDIALDVPVTAALFCFLGGTSWGAALHTIIRVPQPELTPAQEEG